MYRRARFLALALLAGCADSYEPLVDMKGVDAARYQRDLAECRTYGEQVSPASEAAKSGGIGALVGGAIGAVAGAVTGSAGTGAALGAGIGGVSGGASGGLGGAQSQKQVIATCLRNRGYSVLR